jgi:hypothetical protein
MDPRGRFIVVGDYYSNQLVKFSTSGEYLKSVTLNNIIPPTIIDGIVFLDDDHFGLLVRRHGLPTDLYSSFPVFNPDLNLSRRFLQRANDDNLKIRYNNNKSLFRIGDKLLFHEPYFDTVYHLYPDGTEIPLYRIDVGKKGFTREYLSEPAINLNTNQLAFDQVMSVVETPEYLFIRGYANEFFELAYRKETGETLSLEVTDNCYESGIHMPCVENDLFGYGIVKIRWSAPELKVYPDIMWVPGSKDIETIKCIREKKVALPQKRDEFLRLIGRSGDGKLILALLKMREYAPVKKGFRP